MEEEKDVVITAEFSPITSDFRRTFFSPTKTAKGLAASKYLDQQTCSSFTGTRGQQLMDHVIQHHWSQLCKHPAHSFEVVNIECVTTIKNVLDYIWICAG